MKQGKSIVELATELQRQNDAKHDYVAGTQSLVMAPDAKVITIKGAGDFGITEHARRQLAAKLDIPFAYFDRLQKSHPDLLATNVNELFVREPSRNMVRTLDGNVRGFLSDRFRPLDNYDLADAVLPILQKSGAQIQSCEVTETRMYIKATMPWLDRELPVPEGLKMGVGHNWFIRKVLGAISINNSEVGNGRLAVSPGIFEKQCTNLAVFNDEGFGKMHIGKKAEGEEAVTKYLSDETKRLSDAAVWAQVRDLVQATMDGRVMDTLVARMLAARGDAIVGNPDKVVEVFSKKVGLNEAEAGGLLRHLANSGEMNRYGLQWAVTRLAQDVESYDRASELERMGGAVIELPKSDWERIAIAA